ncbi:unnamed protein product [Tuber aestivum]|uniref:Nucleolar protein Dnt1-like N-terminal domain-containing protein n=1 Tax=Tuber aestivum TaxID=59557 RepID=A0A292PS02_9PEZI|nr:unnamed protein product [Tuber aestivum]
MRLQVHVVPGGSPATAPAACSFLEIASPTLTLEALCVSISNRFERLYPHRPPLKIDKIQDSNGNDLDLGYLVSDVFSDKLEDNLNSIVRVLQKSTLRESSIPPESSLRPQFARKRRRLGTVTEVNSNASQEPAPSAHSSERGRMRERLPKRPRTNDYVVQDSMDDREEREERWRRRTGHDNKLGGERDAGGMVEVAATQQSGQLSPSLGNRTPSPEIAITATIEHPGQLPFIEVKVEDKEQAEGVQEIHYSSPYLPHEPGSAEPDHHSSPTLPPNPTQSIDIVTNGIRRSIYDIPTSSSSEDEPSLPVSSHSNKGRQHNGNPSQSPALRKKGAEEARLAAEKAEKGCASEHAAVREDMLKAALAHTEKLRERRAKERAEAERREGDRREVELQEQKRIAAEELEKQRREEERGRKERAENERLERERLKNERLAKEKAERERLAEEKREQERVAKEKAEQEKAERERLAEEKREQERVAKEKAEQEKAGRERLEEERIQREREEALNERREKARERRRVRAAEKKAKERAEKPEREKAEREKAERAEKLEREKAEKAERVAREKAEKTKRLEREKAEKHERERAEKARKQAEYEENNRLAKEAEKQAKERAKEPAPNSSVKEASSSQLLPQSSQVLTTDPESPVPTPNSTLKRSNLKTKILEGSRKRSSVSFAEDLTDISSPTPTGKKDTPAPVLGSKVTPILPPGYSANKLVAEAVVMKTPARPAAGAEPPAKKTKLAILPSMPTSIKKTSPQPSLLPTHAPPQRRGAGEPVLKSEPAPGSDSESEHSTDEDSGEPGSEVSYSEESDSEESYSEESDSEEEEVKPSLKSSVVKKSTARVRSAKNASPLMTLKPSSAATNSLKTPPSTQRSSQRPSRSGPQLPRKNPVPAPATPATETDSETGSEDEEIGSASDSDLGHAPKTTPTTASAKTSKPKPTTMATKHSPPQPYKSLTDLEKMPVPDVHDIHSSQAPLNPSAHLPPSGTVRKTHDGDDNDSSEESSESGESSDEEGEVAGKRVINSAKKAAAVPAKKGGFLSGFWGRAEK